MIYRCDLTRQYQALSAEIDAAVHRVLASGKYLLGEETQRFEAEFAAACGVRHGIAVASGTEALYLALRALGIGPGDEVITSPFTPVPTVSAIAMAGATPVFADIDAALLIAPAAVAAAITVRTRALMPVHLFGAVAAMEPLRELATRHKLALIEDACQAHGSTYHGKPAGSLGDLGCFSFYPTKNLGGYGDGGMVITDRDDLAASLRLLRDYGRDSLYTTVIPGINSRLDEIQAAILRVKLPHLAEWNRRRRAIAGRYHDGLRGLPVEPITEPDGVIGNRHIFTIRCRERRDGLRDALTARAIQVNVYYPLGMHHQQAFSSPGQTPVAFPVCEQACREVLSLPMYAELRDDEVDAVVAAIREFYKG